MGGGGGVDLVCFLLLLLLLLFVCLFVNARARACVFHQEATNMKMSLNVIMINRKIDSAQ